MLAHMFHAFQLRHFAVVLVGDRPGYLDIPSPGRAATASLFDLSSSIEQL
jgi:hypothetical protein